MTRSTFCSLISPSGSVVATVKRSSADVVAGAGEVKRASSRMLRCGSAKRGDGWLRFCTATRRTQLIDGTHAIAHFTNVEQIHWPDVIGRGTTTYRTASKRQGGGNVSGSANTAKRRRGIDQNAVNLFFKAELTDHILVAGMDHQCVAQTFVSQQLHHAVAGSFPVLFDIQTKNRAQLFT